MTVEKLNELARFGFQLVLIWLIATTVLLILNFWLDHSRMAVTEIDCDVDPRPYPTIQFRRHEREKPVCFHFQTGRFYPELIPVEQPRRGGGEIKLPQEPPPEPEASDEPS